MGNDLPSLSTLKANFYLIRIPRGTGKSVVSHSPNRRKGLI
jgi:hypothetical protein